MQIESQTINIINDKLKNPIYQTIQLLNTKTQKYMISYNAKRLHSAIGYKTPNEVYYQAINNSGSKGEKKLQKVS
ncbi:MAG: integrase core domain-containing protein [Campylobacterota bacterium]|nr:integrase core domain-containing protein [Campylobacterota bacterium]